jgi:hypothetical protein
LKLCNEQGELLVKIMRNEWVSGDPLPWDIQADWQLITIRERKRQISLSLNAKNVPADLSARFWHNGKFIRCSNTELHIGTNNVFLKGGLAIVGGPLAIENDALHVGKGPDARIIRWANERERLWKARELWERISRLRS